jgi:hypothetical protein
MKGIHPHDHSLALLASHDTGWWMRRSLLKHVRDCTPCQERLAQFEVLRGELADSSSAIPQMNWDGLAAEMRANIRLGLEAGACVREKHVRRQVNPRLAVAFASLMVIVAASFLLRGSHSLIPAETTAARTVMPAYEPGSAFVSGLISEPSTLEANQDGIALKTGPASMTLLGRQGSTLSQTASAEGEIRARYVDGNTGVVTINNVYLQ